MLLTKTLAKDMHNLDLVGGIGYVWLQEIRYDTYHKMAISICDSKGSKKKAVKLENKDCMVRASMGDYIIEVMAHHDLFDVKISRIVYVSVSSKYASVVVLFNKKNMTNVPIFDNVPINNCVNNAMNKVMNDNYDTFCYNYNKMVELNGNAI